MAESSGIATTISAPGPVLGGFDPGHLLEVVTRLKEAKLQTANTNLQTALQMGEKGLIEPQALEKAVKDWEKASGMKLNDPKTAQNAQTLAKGAQAMSGASGAGTQPSGAQSATPITPNGAAKSPAGGMEPAIDSGNIYENYINQARRTQKYQAMDAEGKAKIDIQLNDLKSRAIAGDETARQQGQAIGIFAYDRNFELMRNASPEDRAAMVQEQINQAKGLESPQQKIEREGRLQNTYLVAGYSPSDAAKLVKDPNAAVPKTLDQLSKEADNYYKLQESFGDEAAKQIAPALAAGASLSEVLPNVGKTQSHFSQQMAETERQHQETMKLEQQRIDVQKEEVGVRKREVDIQEKAEKSLSDYRSEEAKNAAERAKTELLKAENSEFRQNVESMIGAIKQGIAVPKEVRDQYVKELAKRVGMKETQAQSTLNRWTYGLFGQAQEFGPDIDEGKKVLDEVAPAGTSETPKPQSQAPPGKTINQAVSDAFGGSALGKFMGTYGASAAGAAKQFTGFWAHPVKTAEQAMAKLKSGLTLSPEEIKLLEKQSDESKGRSRPKEVP